MSVVSRLSFAQGGAVNHVATALVAVAVFVVALISRVGIIDHPPIYDELYQLLPALSLQDGNGFAILDGIYDRAGLFTRLITFSLDLAGERSTHAARLIPSAIPGALFVLLIFVWARYVAGFTAASIAAFFMIFWPNGIEVSQYIRFYAMQGLVFGAGAILTYTAIVGDRLLWVRGVAVALALLCFLFAAHLQLLTMIGVGGLLLWIAIVHAPGWLRAEPRLWWVLGGGVVAALAILASGIFTNTILRLWETYNWAPWPAIDDRMFYHRDFRDNYPTFWPLFPVAAIIALRANFMVASFCLLLFSTSFVLQSFGGLKNIRYLYPTMPFFFVIWGIALQFLLPRIWTFLKESAPAAVAPVVTGLAGRIVAFGFLAIAILFFVAGNAAFERGLRLTLGKDENELLGKRRWQWTEASEMVRPWVEDRAVIISTEEMRAVEWLGDFDIGYNKPRFSELLFMIGPDVMPFTEDGRSGRPIAGEISDMITVMRCHPVGVALSDAHWAYGRSATTLHDAIVELGGEATRDVRGGVSMVAWRFDGGPVGDADCSVLPDLAESRAADRILSGDREPQAVYSARADR
ncbi:MAG: hypothetical protein AAFW64_10920 [Pseudomonadota bacterium]